MRFSSFKGVWLTLLTFVAVMTSEAASASRRDVPTGPKIVFGSISDDAFNDLIKGVMGGIYAREEETSDQIMQAVLDRHSVYHECAQHQQRAQSAQDAQVAQDHQDNQEAESAAPGNSFSP